MTYILRVVCGIIPLLVIVYIINGIHKTITTKKYGERLEATVVKAEKVNAKGSITYNVDCEFEYKGTMIQKSAWGMREKNIHSEERYIGKKYMIYYYPKYDNMVIEQEYSKKISGGIMIAVICGVSAILVILAVLGDMGYINFK